MSSPGRESHLRRRDGQLPQLSPALRNLTLSPLPEAHYVVIGIDFGTTYSGVSWTWSKAASPDQIEQVHKWDVDSGSARNQESDKVPSRICYDDRGKVLKWGYMVSPQDENQAQWFKLLLSEDAIDQGGAKVLETKRVLRKLKKTAVDVTADFLRCLWKHAIEVIELALTKIAVDNMTFRVVLTLPANWKHSAQELTKKAAIQAGILERRLRGETTFRMVTEPEAAALAAWREAGMRWRPDLQLGDSFVVCDAGGGTVDLISYTVKSLEPLRLEECVEPTGDLCGAVYLDERFESTIRTIVGEKVYDQLDVDVKAKLFENDWEFAAKRKYGGPTKTPTVYQVDIRGYKPKKSGLFGKRPSSTILLEQGHLNSIFQPVIGQIVDLVRSQVSEIRETTAKKPKAVLLVGGFGENNFLMNQLTKTFPVPIQRPTNAWGVISRGAVIKGLSNSVETETVTNFISKLSYGVLHNSRFNPSIHLSADRFKSRLTGEILAREQFTWYLKRGTSVSKIIPVEYHWTRLLRSSWDLEGIQEDIWVSDQKIPPTRLDSGARKLCNFKCNFEEDIYIQLKEETAVDGISKYKELDYTLDMKIAAGELNWSVYWRDQKKGAAKVIVEYE
ncbi:actin-like ATPase domain-containing protein [Cadophora sp. DSE1049]|nr:actin-like ATPase domain-containing protein [Cadophora sp. DSE1049]